tara:strand:- start:1597 stop:1899 length:303 start_codon:yes stop_codon:yes gene_type:complete
VTTFISIFLLVSVFINAVLIWYCRKLTSQFVFFSQNIENLETALQSFDKHLQSIYELEMFYGDDTLEGLLEHSKQLLASVVDFNDSFSIEEEEEEEDGNP